MPKAAVHCLVGIACGAVKGLLRIFVRTLEILVFCVHISCPRFLEAPIHKYICNYFCLFICLSNFLFLLQHKRNAYIYIYIYV